MANDDHGDAPGTYERAGMRAEVFLPDDYRPAENEPFMNDRQLEYFRRKLLAWKAELLEQSAETLEGLAESARGKIRAGRGPARAVAPQGSGGLFQRCTVTISWPSPFWPPSSSSAITFRLPALLVIILRCGLGPAAH